MSILISGILTVAIVAVTIQLFNAFNRSGRNVDIGKWLRRRFRRS